MEHLTIVASRTFTQAKPSAGSFPTCGGAGGYPASTEIIRPHCTNRSTTRSYGDSPTITSAANWARAGEHSPGMNAEPKTGGFGQRGRTIARPTYLRRVYRQVHYRQ